MSKNLKYQLLIISSALLMPVAGCLVLLALYLYGINQTVIEYTQSGEKHKRKHVYVAIHLKNKKKYKLSISENNLNILLNEVRKYQNIEIGFK